MAQQPLRQRTVLQPAQQRQRQRPPQVSAARPALQLVAQDAPQPQAHGTTSPQPHRTPCHAWSSLPAQLHPLPPTHAAVPAAAGPSAAGWSSRLQPSSSSSSNRARAWWCSLCPSPGSHAHSPRGARSCVSWPLLPSLPTAWAAQHQHQAPATTAAERVCRRLRVCATTVCVPPSGRAGCTCLEVYACICVYVECGGVSRVSFTRGLPSWRPPAHVATLPGLRPPPVTKTPDPVRSRK